MSILEDEKESRLQSRFFKDSLRIEIGSKTHQAVVVVKPYEILLLGYRTDVLPFLQCCGSGSGCFWASWIRIRSSSGTDPDLAPDPSIIKQK